MRTWIIALIVAAATIGGGIAIPVHSAAAQATQNVPLVVGVVDRPTIFKKSKAGQSLEQALGDKRKAINAEISKTEQGLRAKRQQLEQQRSSLPPADYQAKVAQLDKEFEALRKSANAKLKDWEQSRKKGLDQILQTLEGVIRDIAQKRGMTLIVDRAMIVMAAEAWDITNEVVKGLDAKLPKVSI